MGGFFFYVFSVMKIFSLVRLLSFLYCLVFASFFGKHAENLIYGGEVKMTFGCFGLINSSSFVGFISKRSI